MRILFLVLLYSNISFGQKIEDYMKVTAYRIIDESTHSPYSVTDYLSDKEYGSVFTAESNDVIMINKLLSLKKKSKKWKKLPHDCHQKGLLDYNDKIDNMFVFEGKMKNDTLFTTAHNRSVVFPDKNCQYLAPSDEINKALSGDMKDFFKRDFESDIWSIHTEVKDSISAGKISYKHTSIRDGINIEKVSEKGTIIKLDSLHVGENVLYEKTYILDKNVYAFDKNQKLESLQIFNIDHYYLDGISPGDPESVLEKYPNSIKNQFPNGTKYEDIKHNYEYVVKIQGNKGLMIFQIRKKIIESITLTFN